MAKGEIAKFLTEDGLELRGFFIDAHSDIGILHIPGINGNFYENPFLDSMWSFAKRKKINFLSMNTRGHDYINEIDKLDGSERKTINVGGALEKFEDCVFDIKAGIYFLKKNGCKKIILQGHSSGCQKITYYAFKTGGKDVCGLILLSQADDMNLIRKMLGKGFGKTMELIKDMIKDNRSGEFMPRGMLGLQIISAGRLYSLCSPFNAEARLFDYTGKMKEVGSIRLPILNVLGGRDIYLTMPAEKILGIVKSRAARAKGFEGIAIKDAPHDFRGCEEQLVRIIIKWLDKIV